MITVVKEFPFEAAHWLPGYNGPCKNLHGHSYRLQVGVSGELDPNTGMVLDFSDLKMAINVYSKVMDHTLLNELREGFPLSNTPFPRKVPTAENMVEWLRENLQNDFSGVIQVTFIRLYETVTSYAEWRA